MKATDDHRTYIRTRLTEALIEAPILRTGDGWPVFLEELRLTAGMTVPPARQGPLQLQVVEVVNACGEVPGGMRAIAEAVELLDPDSAETAEILRWVDEWHAAELLADVEFLWLRRELEEVPATRDVYRSAVEVRQSGLPGYCRTAWQLFANLTGENAIEGALPCLRFLERVAPMLSSATAARVAGLVEELSDDWELADYGADRTTVPAPSASPAKTVCLIIQFEKYGGDDDSYVVSHWRQWATVWQPVRGVDRRVSMVDLEAAVEEIVVEVEREWADRMGPVTIEFVLPDELLDLPVDEFRRDGRSAEPTPLAFEYPIVVRSLNRIRSPQWHRVWRNRWWRVANDQTTGRVLHCAGAGERAVQVEETLDLETVVLVLSEPPAPGNAGESQVRAGLRAGLPAVIWHRAAAVQPLICETVASMIRESGVAELPAHVAELRRRARDSEPGDQHIGKGIVLLWDDPDRLVGQAVTAAGTVGNA